MTKVTTTDGLLGITISDGTTQTTYTPENNTSTASNPIELLKENQSFADIGMLVPPTTDSITINDLIGEPYNYWGDDDGDGQGVNGVAATGSLSVTITDKNGQLVSRDTVLNLCDKAPYKVVLTSTAGSLTTRYGVPNSSNFSGSTATYYINPKATPKICYLVPMPSFFDFEGTLPTIWNPEKEAFLVQSTDPSSYRHNFPTTGANDLYFDLDIHGIQGSTLTWPTISQGGITATMTPSPDNPNNIRVTLTGPVATEAQRESDSPGRIATPTLPQTFVIVGKDSSNREVLKYGFVIKQWFVNRGEFQWKPFSNQSSWCANLGGGYRMPRIKDLTNAKCGINKYNYPCIDDKSPLLGDANDYPFDITNGNNFRRNIGDGFFAEWAGMERSGHTEYYGNIYWTTDRNHLRPNQPYHTVYTGYGHIEASYPDTGKTVICTYP